MISLRKLILAVASCGVFLTCARGEDWGAYVITPVSAPGMVLEVVGASTADGSIVSINKPANARNQKWIITPKGEDGYTIRPASNPRLVLAAAKGGAKNGTQIVVETESGQPWQLWTLVKRDSGNYSLIPQHAPAFGIDDNGGKKEPGSKIDLWTANPNDQHLQWQIRPLAGSGLAPADAPAAVTYQAPEIAPEAILPGTTKQFTFDQSKVFPGTTRDVVVFIPAQYDASKPACVYVKTDGFNPREKTLLETMIATKEIPVTVGVFVRPGEVKPPMQGTLGRRNRDYEYDGVSDNKVRFLVEELLPYIAKEYSLNLSTSGNDRCMSGGSSGGIAAFTAAWHRPEAFSRVYAASGSWVAFRGGHEFPTMVRKFEAKPIRAFLTTATHDMENCAGDWYLLDQEMDKALKFSGYDYQFRIIDGRHVAGYMENWREAMAYLWKGWPERVKAGPSAPRAQDILVPGEGWQVAGKCSEYIYNAACNEKGEVFFAGPEGVGRIDLDGKIGVFTPERAAGVTVGADGRVCTVSFEGKVMSYDEAGRGTLILKAGPSSFSYNSILARPNGGFYLTRDGAETLTEKTRNSSVAYLKDGKLTEVTYGITHATGLAYRPDQWLLAVADGASKWAYSYQVKDDGSLTNEERFFWYHVADWDDDAGVKSLCYAREGQMFAATRSGVQVSADDGPTQVILPVPGNARVTGICLGGRELDTLYAFAGDQIWKRKLKVHAMGAFTPWTKVNGTKL